MTAIFYNQKLLNEHFGQITCCCVELCTFEEKQYLVYDYYEDPHDSQLLACISAFNDDVAACEIYTKSMMGAETGPRGIPDYFRYVILDKENID
jgi:hypothetical protein